MLVTEVTPRSATYDIAASKALSCDSAVGGGILSVTSAIALSLRMPVSSPFSSRTISPPGTSATSRAQSRALAAVLTTAAVDHPWPDSIAARAISTPSP